MIPCGLRELAFGLGLVMLIQAAPGGRLLIVIDQGHLARASVPDALRTVGPAPSRSMNGSTQSLVDRATAHVQRFVGDASFLLADERYVQEVKSRAGSFNLPPTSSAGIVVEKRELESEVAIVQLVEQQVWLVARDVIRMDGKPIPDSEREPMPATAATSMTDALARFREIADRGARFNIGPIRRNLNVPTLALWFLTPGVRDRFDFKRDGETSVDGVRCDVLRYREHGKGMMQGDGQPVAAAGRFLIARDSGAVVRTELVLANFSSNWSGRSPMPGARVSIAVSYRLEPSVGSWVPATMEERYDHPGRRDLNWVVGAATYTNYRRFQVGTRIVR